MSGTGAKASNTNTFISEHTTNTILCSITTWSVCVCVVTGVETLYVELCVAYIETLEVDSVAQNYIYKLI